MRRDEGREAVVAGSLEQLVNVIDRVVLRDGFAHNTYSHAMRRRTVREICKTMCE